MDSDPLYYDPDPHLKVTNRPTDTHMNIKQLIYLIQPFIANLSDLNTPTTFVQAGHTIKLAPPLHSNNASA